MTDQKSHSQARFSHSKGGDLDRLFELADPQPDWIALDIATGGGHTALKIAPSVHSMTALDYAPVMLEAARTFITSKGATNVDYVAADAENLPYPGNTFDLITCRIAPHHFPDIFRFVQECARALKPGGTLVIQDQTVPDERRDADYIDAFERLRDPSHGRALPIYEWEGTFLDAGLLVDHAERVSRKAPFMEWVERQGCSPEVVEHLQIMLIQAPEPVAKWMNIHHAGSSEAIFDHVHMIMKGHKPST